MPQPPPASRPSSNKPDPYAAPTQHAPHGLGGAVPAWFHQMEPAVRRTYERLLHEEMDARLSFDAARDIMNRTYGKPIQPISQATTATVDHRHMHLSAVQAFNEPLSAGTVGQAQLEQQVITTTIDTIITSTPSIYDQPDDYTDADATPDFLL